MLPKDILKLKKLLLSRRLEMLKQVAHLEAEQEELEQRFIEPIDAAQTFKCFAGNPAVPEMCPKVRTESKNETPPSG